VLALRRSDFDIDAGTVSIERGWTVSEKGRKTLGDPKSQAGNRKLHLPLHVLTVLKAHLNDYAGPDKDAWLFPGSNGQPLHPRTFDRVWTTTRQAIGRPDLHFHDLRGSGLTWIAQKGATNAELMHRGGHSSVTSVMIYQNAAAELDKALAMALDLTPNETDPPSPKLAVVRG
jgi:integrase